MRFIELNRTIATAIIFNNVKLLSTNLIGNSSVKCNLYNVKFCNNFVTFLGYDIILLLIDVTLDSRMKLDKKKYKI